MPLLYTGLFDSPASRCIDKLFHVTVVKCDAGHCFAVWLADWMLVKTGLTRFLALAQYLYHYSYALRVLFHEAVGFFFFSFFFLQQNQWYDFPTKCLLHPPIVTASVYWTMSDGHLDEQKTFESSVCYFPGSEVAVCVSYPNTALTLPHSWMSNSLQMGTVVIKKKKKKRSTCETHPSIKNKTQLLFLLHLMLVRFGDHLYSSHSLSGLTFFPLTLKIHKIKMHHKISYIFVFLLLQSTDAGDSF